MSANLIVLRMVERVRLPHDCGSYLVKTFPRRLELDAPAEIVLNRVWLIAKYGKRGYRARRTRKQVVEHRRQSDHGNVPTVNGGRWNESRRRDAPALLPTGGGGVGADGDRLGGTVAVGERHHAQPDDQHVDPLRGIARQATRSHGAGSFGVAREL